MSKHPEQVRFPGDHDRRTSPIVFQFLSPRRLLLVDLPKVQTGMVVLVQLNQVLPQKYR